MSGKHLAGEENGERGLSDKKSTLVLFDREFPRRVALPVMGGILAVFGGFFYGVWSLIQLGKEEDTRSSDEDLGLRNIARRHRWRYSFTESGVVDELEGVEPFPDISTGLVVSDYTRGRYRGRDIRYFEYADEDTGTKVNGRTTSDYYAVFAVSTPGTVPRTLIREKGFADSVFGGGEIVGTGDQAFDDDYRVISDDPPSAKRIATARLTRYLADEPLLQDRPLRFEKGEVLTWYEERLRAEDVMENLDYLSRVVQRIPDSAWE